MAGKRLGKKEPRYSFILNPHEGTRLSRCPRCEGRTHPRKFVLFIVVDGFGPLALGKTCKFCTRCALIMAHKDELEHELTIAFEKRDPAIIGNEYMVFGTVDKKVWQKGLEGEAPDIENMLDHVADFEREFDLHYDPGGWRPAE
ncbi:MAG: hypothetical protein H0U65_03305 [Rubrobacter sp.]|jgi:hypothetical protein|nr:hypothetical protein [Rubrobacter sp.]